MKNNIKGFSFVEMMVTMAILSILTIGIYMTLSAGQNTWLDTDTNIRLQENLRLTLEKISKELRETGVNAGGLVITNSGGVNNSDVIRFSMPVVCEAGGSIIDANTDVANWGAPLTWGCTASTCMDADDDCTTVDYQYVQYLIDANGQLLRRVLDGALTVVRTDVFAQNITDFQAVLNGGQTVITLTVTASKTSETKRAISNTASLNIYLRNRG